MEILIPKLGRENVLLPWPLLSALAKIAFKRKILTKLLHFNVFASTLVIDCTAQVDLDTNSEQTGKKKLFQ